MQSYPGNRRISLFPNCVQYEMQILVNVLVSSDSWSWEPLPMMNKMSETYQLFQQMFSCLET